MCIFIEIMNELQFVKPVWESIDFPRLVSTDLSWCQVLRFEHVASSAWGLLAYLKSLFLNTAALLACTGGNQVRWRVCSFGYFVATNFDTVGYTQTAFKRV